MKIKNVEYLDKSRNECFLTLVNKDAELVCFSDMKEFSCEEEINIPLETLSVNNVVICNDETEMILKKGDHSYNIIGRLINKVEGIIITKSFLIHLDPGVIPNDINDNDYIYFEVNRFDLY